MAGSKGRRDKNTEPVNLAKAPPINEITLSDGKTYPLAPLNINMLCELEAQDPAGAAASDLLFTGKVKWIRYIIWLRLKVQHPEMTLEHFGELLTFESMLSIKKQLGL